VTTGFYPSFCDPENSRYEFELTINIQVDRIADSAQIACCPFF